MTPLPAGLDDPQLVVWRIDPLRYASTWDSGIGAQTRGGRWNNVGIPCVYCTLDPAVAILEKAVHGGFDYLDTQPHVLTSVVIPDSRDVHVVRPDDLPNPMWLMPAAYGQGQRDWGDRLTAEHPFVVLPSTVSVRSWNLVFRPEVSRGRYARRSQERLALDTRLQPPR